MSDGGVTRAVRAAVRRGIGGVRAQGRDVAAVALALEYAAALDGVEVCEHCGRGADAGDVVKLGPLLLAVLESLALTPRARAAAGRPPVAPAAPVETELQRLQREHAARGRAG